jgi:hypothetical protein
MENGPIEPGGLCAKSMSGAAKRKIGFGAAVTASAGAQACCGGGVIILRLADPTGYRYPF